METRPDDQPRTRLDRALIALDAAFAGIPSLGAAGGCGYCFTDEALALLGGAPALVPEELVGRFARKGADHWDPDHYGTLWRRMAPRIVRYVVRDGSEADPGLTLRGAREAGVDGWSTAERRALSEALDALLSVAVTEWSPSSVLDLLDGLAQVDGEVPPALHRIEAMTGPASDAGIVRLALHLGVDLLRGYEPQWWFLGYDTEALLTGWLCSPPVEERVRSFAARHSRCKTAADALVAIDALRRGDGSPWYLFGSWSLPLSAGD